jgi:hypothetical protein
MKGTISTVLDPVMIEELARKCRPHRPVNVRGNLGRAVIAPTTAERMEFAPLEREPHHKPVSLSS